MNYKDYEAMSTALFDILFEDNHLGNFEITLPPYMVENPSDMWGVIVAKMNVVFKHDSDSDGFRMPVIIVENNGKYQDFYYNSNQNVWKPLSEENDTMESWWNEEDVSDTYSIPEMYKDVYAVGNKIMSGIDNISIYCFED